MKKNFDLLKTTIKEWSEDKAAKLAASLSYYTVFSLAPLMVILIALVGLVGGVDATQGLVLAQVEDLLGAEGAQFMANMIETSSNRPSTGIIATVLGLVTLLFGALGVFGELQNSLNTIWEVKPKPANGLVGTLKSLFLDRLLSFAMILVIGFLLLVSLVVSAGIAGFTDYIGGVLPFSDLFIQSVNFIVSLGVITLLFAMMFKFLPDAKIAWKDVWLGALVTAALFSIGKYLIGMYLGRSDVGSTFGAAGSLAILLLWVYYSAQILFLGAEFTQTYANMYGSGIVPNENAIKLGENERVEQGIPHDETVEAKARADGNRKGYPALVRVGSEPDLTAQLSVTSPRYSSKPSPNAGRIVGVALLSGFVAGIATFARIFSDFRGSRRP